MANKLLKPKNDISGQRFTRLIVISFAGYKQIYKSRRRDALWVCKCDCGNTCEAIGPNLRNGRIKSCGCLRLDNFLKVAKSQWQSCDPLDGYYQRYQYGAKTRKYSFKLTKAEFEKIIYQPCHYCGSIPSIKYPYQRKDKHILVNGIDRKDNTKGYIKNNCLPCCKKCNLAKRDYKYVEFLDWIKAIKNHDIKD